MVLFVWRFLTSAWRAWRRFVSKAFLQLSYACRGEVDCNTTKDDTRLERLPMASFPGSTGTFFRVEPGVLLKAPVKVGQDEIMRERPDMEHHFKIEEQILRRLGAHPRVVRFLGVRSVFPAGLLLAEADRGDLQSFLREHSNSISNSLRQKWFFQVIESIVFIHSHGVIHSDLRPENFLVHGTDSPDLWLCDFGGSTCRELSLSAHKLPDSGFFNPSLPWEPTVAVDLFSLGSVLYTIAAGHWPFRTNLNPFTHAEELEEYEAKADASFADGVFPDTGQIFGGEIIQGCWTAKFSSVRVLQAAAEMLK